ncbi:hypothetical protein NFI96_022085 [Prochilodus magdalenae]|nr:hypothetical protein NFI96_022085 [Prochilodus magdalenae]
MARMSQTVVTTRTTTTTTTSSSDGGFLNLGYVRTFPGLLKVAQVDPYRTTTEQVLCGCPSSVGTGRCLTGRCLTGRCLTGRCLRGRCPTGFSTIDDDDDDDDQMLSHCLPLIAPPSSPHCVCVQIALLIAFLCVHCAPGWTDISAYRYFEVVTLWFLFAFLIFLVMYIFRLQPKLPCINWTLTEFLHYALGTILVLIASIVASVKSGGNSPLVAGSVFGFIATFLMAFSLWTSYKVTCGSQPTSAAV